MSKYYQRLQEYFHDYEEEHGHEPAQLADVAYWMIAKGLWEIRPTDLVQRCAEDLSRALREEYRKDNKGRKYRVNHAVRENQVTLWAPLDNAPRDHMEKAFAQRRRQIVGDCIQLKTDVDVYNDLHEGNEPIQMVLDFTEDVEEAQALFEEDAA